MGQIRRKSSIFQPLRANPRAKSLHPLSLRLIHSKTAPSGKIGRKGALTPRLARTHRNTFQHFSAARRRADFILSVSPVPPRTAQSSPYSFPHSPSLARFSLLDFLFIFSFFFYVCLDSCSTLIFLIVLCNRAFISQLSAYSGVSLFFHFLFFTPFFFPSSLPFASFNLSCISLFVFPPRHYFSYKFFLRISLARDLLPSDFIFPHSYISVQL